MPRLVALLRAINVGGHTVRMEELRTLFESMRLRSVETVIASGNVIFETGSTDADALARHIESGLERALGYAVGVFLRTPAELRAAADRVVFPGKAGAAGHSLYVLLLKEPLPPDRVRL